MKLTFCFEPGDPRNEIWFCPPFKLPSDHKTRPNAGWNRQFFKATQKKFTEMPIVYFCSGNFYFKDKQCDAMKQISLHIVRVYFLFDGLTKWLLYVTPRTVLAH